MAYARPEKPVVACPPGYYDAVEVARRNEAVDDLVRNSSFVKCRRCRGTGVMRPSRQPQQDAPSEADAGPSQCPACLGEGKLRYVPNEPEPEMSGALPVAEMSVALPVRRERKVSWSLPREPVALGTKVIKSVTCEPLPEFCCSPQEPKTPWWKKLCCFA